MLILVAPDKFRGTLTAAEASRAIAAGWRRARPDDEIEEVPLADGGEGTLDVLVEAFGGDRRTQTVTGPIGEPTRAAIGLIDRDERPLAVVEMSRASGLHLVPPNRRDVKRATTRGTGELVRTACRAARDVLVCIGGSATNDGGAGMAQSLGVHLLDAQGRELAPGGAALLELSAIDASGLDPAAARARVSVACDVPNPLTGPRGASVVYGPQKGSTPDDVRQLDRALAHFADVIERDLGVDVREIPGAGAAGGLGAGLVAFLGARLRPGADLVMDATAFSSRMERADLLVTGEGSLDEQSVDGKVPAAVLRLAREMGTPVVILCGRASVHPEGVRVESLIERFGERRAVEEAGSALEDLAAIVSADR